jgi:hypothetical protein
MALQNKKNQIARLKKRIKDLEMELMFKYNPEPAPNNQLKLYNPFEITSIDTTTSLVIYDDCPTVTGLTEMSPKKENNMDYYTATALKQDRKYLRNRLQAILDSKDHELREKFNLIEVRPASAKEAIDWLSKGNFEVGHPEWMGGEADLSKMTWGDFTHHFEWTDPSRPEDRDGYNAAYKTLSKAYTAAEDMIVVAEKSEDALKAVQEFESATFN